jgi:hypothetical protein
MRICAATLPGNPCRIVPSDATAGRFAPTALFTLAQRPRSDFRRTKKLLCLTGMPPISHIPHYKGQRPPG